MTKASRIRRLPSEREQELPADQDPFARESIEHLVSRYGSPLFLIDAERVRAQYRRLAAALPGVELYYAIKSLPHASVVAVLRDAGAHFDLATNGEVELVRRLGVAPGRCIHTHPIKRDSDIRTALAYGVTHFVVDNEDELRKFVKYRTRAQLLIRLAFRSDAVVDLSRKFGCDPDAVAPLLALAAQLRIPVAGLSFHAGSQAAAPQMHVQAVEVCAELMRGEGGRALTLLDIGGGFPIDYLQGAPPAAIGEFCAPIRAALGALDARVRVIAEPGRYISAPSAIAVSSVMGRAQRGGRWWYYLDDGLYGSYSGQMYDHARYPLEALAADGPRYPSVLAGPTCDSIDVICEHIELPLLEQGDLVVGRVMGAYTWASASEFNFFPRATVLALDRGRLVREGEVTC
ncbi:MAG TPA: type III PLP-dependent enzyme [Steroidobacteraceae bacterium]|nr:type III PLP-dependent enzyme [Steroidobacteraceae bacterium]